MTATPERPPLRPTTYSSGSDGGSDVSQSALFSRESWHYGVMRPDFVLIEGMTEVEARAYVERGNADGSTRYSLCRRPVGAWENLTNPAPHTCIFLVTEGVMQPCVCGGEVQATTSALTPAEWRVRR